MKESKEKYSTEPIIDTYRIILLIIAKDTDQGWNLLLARQENDPLGTIWSLYEIVASLSQQTSEAACRIADETIRATLVRETGISYSDINLFFVSHDNRVMDDGSQKRSNEKIFLVVVPSLSRFFDGEVVRNIRWFPLQEILMGRENLLTDHLSLLRSAIIRYTPEIFPKNTLVLSKDPKSVKAMKLPVPVSVRIAPKSGSLMTPEGPVSYQAGDALLTGSDGDTWPVERSLFDATYECSPDTNEGGDGTYFKKPLEIVALQLETPMTVFVGKNKDPISGLPGDWLVEYFPGQYGIVAEKIFEKTYRFV